MDFLAPVDVEVAQELEDVVQGQCVEVVQELEDVDQGQCVEVVQELEDGVLGQCVEVVQNWRMVWPGPVCGCCPGPGW